tara:strand:- start:9 stop:812 length:804 start_codon:yes stop_codon:yes gene_type:complete
MNLLLTKIIIASLFCLGGATSNTSNAAYSKQLTKGEKEVNQHKSNSPTNPNPNDKTKKAEAQKKESSSSSQAFRERLQKIVSDPRRQPNAVSSKISTSKAKSVAPKAATRNKSVSTKPIDDSNQKFYDGAWLKRNYQLQVTVEMILDDGKKTVHVNRWIISRAHMKSSDIIGFTGGVPMTSEIEATIQNAKDNKLLISLFYGVRIPYNARPKTTSSSSRGFGGYTQFLDSGLETGVQVELGKPITIWDTEIIKLTLMAKSWNEVEDK